MANRKQNTVKSTEFKRIPIKSIDPNPWNPNRMDAITWDALGQSMEEFGSDIDPLLVRKVGSRYQVIDGEHRLKQVGDGSVDELGCIIIEATDTEAKRLTQIMNRTRGEDDPVRLKELYESLLDEMTAEDIVHGMAIDGEDGLNGLLQQLEDPSTIPIEVETGAEYFDNPGRTKEINPDDFDLQHRCPRCNFEFND